MTMPQEEIFGCSPKRLCCSKCVSAYKKILKNQNQRVSRIKSKLRENSGWRPNTSIFNRCGLQIHSPSPSFACTIAATAASMRDRCPAEDDQVNRIKQLGSNLPHKTCDLFEGVLHVKQAASLVCIGDSRRTAYEVVLQTRFTLDAIGGALVALHWFMVFLPIVQFNQTSKITGLQLQGSATANPVLASKKGLLKEASCGSGIARCH